MWNFVIMYAKHLARLLLYNEQRAMYSPLEENI